jgi:hypothetical protein
MKPLIRLRLVRMLNWQSADWENAVYDAVPQVANSAEVRLADDSVAPDIAIAIYPASAHGELRSTGRLGRVIAKNPALRRARFVLCACDRSDPELSDAAVWSLLNEQLDEMEFGYALRAATTDLLTNGVIKSLLLTAKESAMGRSAAAGGLTVHQRQVPLSPSGGEDEWKPGQYL